MSGKTREGMVHSAAKLLRSNGVRGTSFARVLEDSGAPRGSVGHHFPGGKDELVLAALTAADAEIAARLRGLAEGGARSSEIVDALCGYFAEGLERTGYRAGCPVAAVAQEAFEVDALREVADAALAGWVAVLADVLRAEGRTADEAEDAATTCVATVEGAIMLARVRRDRGPLDAVRRQLGALLGRA